MARATYSPILLEIQGALGPVTFTKSPYGPIAKPTVRDAQQPDTPAQQAVRNRMRTVAAFWNAMTDAQRIAWNTAALTVRHIEADTKVSFRSSGFNLYSSLANVWLQANNTGTPPIAPPSGAYAGSSVTITAAATANTVTFTGSSSLPTGTVIQYELQPIKTASRKPSKNGYRVKAVTGFTGTGTSYAITVTPGAYAARYCFVNKSTGQRTGFVEIPVSGVALSIEQGGADAAAIRAKKAA